MNFMNHSTSTSTSITISCLHKKHRNLGDPGSVTILLYLNDWQPGDGGELRLFAPAKNPAATTAATALGSSGLLKAGEAVNSHSNWPNYGKTWGKNMSNPEIDL